MRRRSWPARMKPPLLLVAGDPTRDITAINDIKMVVRRGRPIELDTQA